MTLVDAGHCYGFAVHQGTVFISWDFTAIVTIPYRGGKTAVQADATPLAIPDKTVQVSLSDDRAELVVMAGSASNRIFTRRLVSDVLAGRDVRLGKVDPPHNGTLQGFTLRGDYLYLLYGSSDSKAWIEKWSFVTGKKVATLDVTAAGFLPGETPGKREPEGMDGGTFGVKVWQGDARRMRVFELVNF
jgi:hypothetical protein